MVDILDKNLLINHMTTAPILHIPVFKLSPSMEPAKVVNLIRFWKIKSTVDLSLGMILLVMVILKAEEGGTSRQMSFFTGN